MFMSLIICSKDRAAQLQLCLKEVARASPPPCAFELVLVDNGPSDTTRSVIQDFVATSSSLKVQYVECKTPGLGRARNSGIAAAKGEWLLFTDDDCYVEPEFFVKFFEFVNACAASTAAAKDIRYGSGPIAPYDAQHDPRVATLTIDTINLIQPRTMMGAGMVQGANMFFHRSVFEKAGLFNDRMGSGTPFACEDIEMAARASIAGFLGAQVPFFKVMHHHKRLLGSAQANATIEEYDYGRGAYYASMIDQGFPQFWQLWEKLSPLQKIKNPDFRMRLVREMEGAAKYLKALR